MLNVLWKDFLREIRKSSNRFIAIFAIVFIGVAFFAGVKATAPEMKSSMDAYYDEYNLMDIRIMSTLGLTQDDINAIAKTDQVERVQPGYFTDVVSNIDSKEMVIKVHSIPDAVKTSDEAIVNRYQLTEGRYPQNSGECIIEDTKYFDLKLEIGDKIKVSSGKITKITEDTLVTDEFTIVGKARTPYYLTYDKGSSELGSGKVNFFIGVLASDFKIPVYTEALVTVKGAKQLNSYGDGYNDVVGKVVSSLENLGVDRSDIRLGEVKAAALEQLNSGKKQYEEQKQLYADQIKAAETKLNDIQAQIAAGDAQLATEKKNFDANYASASQQIAAGEVQLAEGKVQYEEALDSYNSLFGKYGDELDNIDRVVTRINTERADAQNQVDSINQKLQDPNITDDQRASYQNLLSQYDNLIGYADQALASANELNDLGQTQKTSAKDQLDSAKTKIDTEEAALVTAKKQLQQGKITSQSKFAVAGNQLSTAKAEYETGKAEYEKQKAEGDAKLAAANEEIIRGENKIEALSKPSWYVLDRNSNLSFVDYGLNADRIDSIATIFPVFFLLVAALVCLTTMTRMVDEQRGVIGTYKALGYSNRGIAAKYVLYAGIASMLGGVTGVFLGINVFPKVIYNAWSMMYNLPAFKSVTQIPLMVTSVIFAILVTTLAAFWACTKSLKETPALLMRPKAPKMGSSILLEKIDGLWSRMSFSQKVTARNLFRYKKRFYMTVFGIAGCSALLLAGFGLNNSITNVVKNQYKEIFTYNVNMRLKADATIANLQSVTDSLSSNKNVKSYITITETNATVKGKDGDISVNLIVPKTNEELKDYITLRDRVSQKPVNIAVAGVVISEKLAKELSVGIGDTIQMDNGDGANKKVEISGITENYIFHYAYMTPEYYKSTFRLSPKINSIMIKLNEAGSIKESELGGTLNKLEGVGSIEYYSQVADTFSDTVKILQGIVIIIIISAGILAFVVVYNLTNINIGERIREIATIKVLGFYNDEVASFVYRENIILAVIGSLAGLLLGTVLHRFIMTSIEQNGIMFGYHIEPISYLYSFIITLGFVLLVLLVMYRRLKKIPMVESLKSVE